MTAGVFPGPPVGAISERSLQPEAAPHMTNASPQNNRVEAGPWFMFLRGVQLTLWCT
jgi:hypothetical protein